MKKIQMKKKISSTFMSIQLQENKVILKIQVMSTIFQLITIKSCLKSFIRFYKTKLMHYNAIAEQNINSLHQEAIKFKELIQNDLSQYQKNTANEQFNQIYFKFEDFFNDLIFNLRLLLIMDDLFGVFLGNTDKFNLEDNNQDQNKAKKKNKNTDNEIYENQKPVFKSDDFKINHKLYYSNKIQDFPVEKKEEKTEINNQEEKLKIPKKKKIRAKINLQEKEQELLKKIQTIQKTKKNQTLEAQTWKPRKFQQNKVSLNLKQKYQERKQGLSRIQKKSKWNNPYKNQYNTPEFNINMVASAEFTIQELLQSYNSIIKKDNLYFKFMNESVKWHLLKPVNLSPSDQRRYDQNQDLLREFAFNEKISLVGNQQLLTRVFKHEDFYEFQKQAFQRLQKPKCRLMVNSFTGSGKSLIYQFNALKNPGITFVLIPYISIIVDQIQKVPQHIPSVTINSWLSYPQKKKFYDLIFTNQVKLVYMTPETFLGEFYQEILENKDLKISMLCVDETHCAVPWDNSFRISYLALPDAINVLSQTFENMKFLFLTATADQKAQNFLKNQFHIEQQNLISTGNYVRQNSNIKFQKTKDQNTELLKALKYNFEKKKPILVFCNFINQSTLIANFLIQNGFNSFCFHGQLTEIQKLTILQELITSQQKDDENDLGNFDAIIATISLSMGLDVAQIKGVIHYNFPKFLEIYIQQIGRAGRNGNDSKCLLLLSKKDLYFSRNKTISSHLIGRNQIKSILEYLIQNKNGFVAINCSSLSKRFKMEQEQFEKVLTIIILTLKKFDGFQLQFYSNVKNSYILKSYSKDQLLKDHFDNKKIIDFSHVFDNSKDLELNDMILDFLKKRLTKKDSIKFQLTEILNKFCDYQVSEILKIFKKYDQVQNIGFTSQDLCYLFKINCENLEENERLNIVDQVQKEIINQLQTQIFKIDFFYFLCHYVSNFENSKEAQQKFRELVTLYFEKEDKELKNYLQNQYNFQNMCPIIYIKNSDDFQIVKNIFSDFYSENIEFLKSSMSKQNSYYQVFADSLRYLLGINSSLYPLKSSINSPNWGCLQFYSFEDFYYIIEDIFQQTFKEIGQENFDLTGNSGDEKITNKKIVNQFNK